MQNVNWWLMALAFLLGLVLTLFLMIRRVRCEVPEYAAAGGAAGAAGAAKLTGRGAADVDADDDATLRVPKADADADTAKAGATAGGATAVAAIADVPPGRHGPGSATPGAGGSGPSGWTIKGNEDSMLYHTTDSPSYERTVAEVWFLDVETAENAGFNRWDSGKSQRERDQR